MRMYLPRVRRLLKGASRTASISSHLTTPGPVGLAAITSRGERDSRWSAASTPTWRPTPNGSADRRGSAPSCANTCAGPTADAHACSCPSEDTRAAADREAAGSTRRADLWTRGVDARASSPPQPVGGAARALAGLGPRVRQSSTLGRLSKEKGLDLLTAISGAPSPCVEHRLDPRRRRTDARGAGRRSSADAVFTGPCSLPTSRWRWRPRTCSCFRATPTRPATSCSRRRPAACRCSCRAPADRRNT